MFRRLFLGLLGGLLASPIRFARADAAPVTVSFVTTDGLTVVAEREEPEEGTVRGTLILFHQADGNAQEYAPLLPRLTGLGFAVLAVNQRSGGNLFGGTNPTRDAYGFAPMYEEAMPDFQAALDYATGMPQPVVLVGSSYAAGMIFALAARNPGKVGALAAFSPGDYFFRLKPVVEAAGLGVSAFITSDGSADEVKAAQVYADTLAPGMAVVFVPDSGVHGASALREDRNPGSYQDYWTALEAFLDQAVP
jgi:pimeloyl-ACP methyl ester carboxylesterase